MPKRDTGLDVIKAVAMFLVVLLHVRLYAPVPDAYRAPTCIENFCTVSALPLFFMISGLFSRRLLSDLSVRALLMRYVAYLWPVATMFGGVGVSVRILMGASPVPQCGLPSYILSAGWFFFCLSLCETLTFAAHYLSRGKSWLRVALLASGYAVLWALPFGMFHAVEMLPFFWFGAYALPHLREGRFGNAVGFCALVAFVAACCVADDFRKVGLNFHLTSMNLLSFSLRGFALMLGRIALGLAGALGLLTLVHVAVVRWPVLGRLAPFGTQTMGIFFVHVLLLAVYYEYVGWHGGGMAGRLALAVALFFVSHYVVVLTKRNRIVGALLWNPLAARGAGRGGSKTCGGK